jgi:MoaA/NifB/PqqE/SkfB family radical SAM enzyme
MSKVKGMVGEVRRVFNQTELDSLILFVTNACNLSCGFCCYADNLNQTRDIRFDDMVKISASMPPFRNLMISGGEPFLRHRLDEILLAFVRNNDVSTISIPTNGWYREKTERACKSFLDQESTTTLTLNFSVDGLPATHNAIRGKPETFDNLCTTLESMLPWRDRYPNLRFRVNSVVTPGNIGEIRATIDYFYERFDLDEHGVEIVRDEHAADAHHDSPERRAIADELVELTRYSYDLYFRRDREPRGKLGYLPEPMSNLLNYAHNLAMTDVKRDRMNGKLWSFPCTAGRKIFVIDGSGTLRSCEHRPEVIDLREFDFDVAAALATGAMEREVEQITRDRCDCLHGCFIGNSLQHAPKAVVTRVGPRALDYYTTKRRTPMPAPVLERVDGLLTSPDAGAPEPPTSEPPKLEPTTSQPVTSVPVATPVLRRSS